MSNKTNEELLNIYFENHPMPNDIHNEIRKGYIEIGFISACELKDTEITLLKERVKLLELIIIEFPMSHNKSFYRAVWEEKYKTELDSIRLKRE